MKYRAIFVVRHYTLMTYICIIYNYVLTLYGPKSFFRSFSGQDLRYTLFVYRLIGATLIGHFFDDPFLK